jgi:DNA-binding transcriptional MerR regulator
VSERAHLSIGEVLTLLQDDFPDVTISKIRFLESQGLLDPERTPSGYRKFYDGDIDRLRWILRQQRENFLPLKVIKDRLASGEVDFSAELVGAGAADADGVGSAPDAAAVAATSEPAPAAAPEVPEPAAGEPAPAPAPAARPAARASTAPDPALLQEAPSPRSSRDGGGAVVAPRRRNPAPLLEPGPSSMSMTLDELTAATGLSARDIGDLERFGMISSRSLGTTTYYDDDAVLVAQIAASFRSHGVEARHLRMYKVAAEREAGVFEQLLTPLARKRSPTARRQSAELVNELAALGDGLRAAMLRQLLREYVDGV